MAKLIDRPSLPGGVDGGYLIPETYEMSVRILHRHLIETDADHWKTWVHQRLSTPLDKPGTMTLFRAQPNEHLALAAIEAGQASEAKTEEFIAGKGPTLAS